MIQLVYFSVFYFICLVVIPFWNKAPMHTELFLKFGGTQYC